MFKSLVKTASVVVALATSSLSFSAPMNQLQVRVANAAGKLNMTAAMVAKFGQSQQNFAIEAGAQNISQFANLVETAARFGTVMDAENAVNMVVMEYMTIRTEFMNVNNPAQGNMVRLTLRNAINQILPLLGQGTVYCTPSENNDCEEPTQIPVNGGEWDDRNSGNGHTGGGNNGGWGN